MVKFIEAVSMGTYYRLLDQLIVNLNAYILIDLEAIKYRKLTNKYL